jgi:3-hydroxyacyl-CoA dehydrogenase
MMSAFSRKIKKVAVLGSGVMGSRIACHFANIGLDVLLLDIPAQGAHSKNELVHTALQNTIKSNPSPLYDKRFLTRIKTGNFEENLCEIADCDWTIEVVIENLEIKKNLFAEVEKYRKPGTLITSNTSGIPIEYMIEGRSDDFSAHFCGTHFFNPPRYLKLFEIIPSSKTHAEVIAFFKEYAFLYLGKTPVLCKDTPAFIANRVGVFSMMTVAHLMQKMNLKIEDVDALTGPLTGKPKSATFRTGDVVGIDTLVKVAHGVSQNDPNDEQKAMFDIPSYIDYLVQNQFFGDKSKQGFYKKTTKEDGSKEILVFDWSSLTYRSQDKTKYASVGAARNEENLTKRLQLLHRQNDEAALFLKTLNLYIFSYVSHRIPEIADHLHLIDDAMRAGFGWEMGPFEIWDALGVRSVVEEIEKEGLTIAPWVKELLTKHSAFYKIENGVKSCYSLQSGNYEVIEGANKVIKLDIIRGEKTIWKNSGCSILDLGDGIINVEFRTKMNAIGGEIMEGIHKAIDLAEKDHRGVVLGNDAPNFSAGANLAMIYMLALEQEYEELNMVIRMFQNTVMRLRYSAIPVVGAPHGLTLGGGCEMMMHCDAVVAAAETYIGLVEVGVGLIPGGGGTKELTLRVSDANKLTDPFLPLLGERFTAIATAKTATSAYEAFDIGVLDHKKDLVAVNGDRIILEAKQRCIQLADEGYTQPKHRKDIMVMGKTGLAGLYAGIEGFSIGGYASDHDKKIAQKIAWIMCGGDLSAPTEVTEQYLLDLEREAFLSLLGEKKTLERIQSILTSGKPLRN